MPGLVVKVDDRVILSSAIAAGLLYFGLAWHRAYFVARSSASAGADRGDRGEQQETSAEDSEQTWASRLLEKHFASVHDSERPFREDLLIQVRCLRRMLCWESGTAAVGAASTVRHPAELRFS